MPLHGFERGEFFSAKSHEQTGNTASRSGHVGTLLMTSGYDVSGEAQNGFFEIREQIAEG